MKHLIYILICAITLWALACCSNDEPDFPVDNKWENHTPLNKNDSIAITALLKNLKAEESWELPESIDIHDYRNWKTFSKVNFHTIKDEINNEIRVTGIFIPNYCRLPLYFQLPKEISMMDSLKMFSIISYIGPICQIQKEIFDCPLEYLELSGATFWGSIPPEIKKLSGTLKELRIYDTQITEIPEEIATLQNLTIPARLTSNKLSGKVPLFFRELPYGANLDDNNFTEMDWRFFTEDIGVVPSLRENLMCGKIPEDLFGTKRFSANKYKIFNQKGSLGWINEDDAY